MYRITMRSGNRKTGPIPVSMTERSSCPTSCPLKGKGKGCYGESWPLSLHWDALDSGKFSIPVDRLAEAIRYMPDGQLWRHNQVGDLPGLGDRLDTAELAVIVEANRGRRGFTYTHKPLDRSDEREAVWAANRAGFTVNLSANGLEHADVLAETGAGPVVSGVPADHPTVSHTPAGRKVVVCPAQTSRDDVTCQSCGLCARADRTVIVAFRAHGASARAAGKVFLPMSS